MEYLSKLTLLSNLGHFTYSPGLFNVKTQYNSTKEKYTIAIFYFGTS